MKRHPALTDLARDHFHALRCSQRIRKATTDEEIQSAAEALAALWRDDLIHHFREEEEVLLPILSRHINPSDNIDIRRMLDDHAFLRDGLRRLDKDLQTRHLDLSQLKILGERLEQHARLEDRIIFTLCEQMLTEGELEEIASLSHHFRTQWHRPLGPLKAHTPTP